MTPSTDPTFELAEAVLDHARAITRLDAAAAGFGAAVRAHVEAMRLLAAAHVDPALDRRFFKALQACAGDGVFVRFEDGVALVLVDHPRQPQRFELVSPAQALRRAEYGPIHWS